MARRILHCPIQFQNAVGCSNDNYNAWSSSVKNVLLRSQRANFLLERCGYMTCNELLEVAVKTGVRL
eukprot:3994559-Pleurochrysis_carterae.AAC.1